MVAGVSSGTLIWGHYRTCTKCKRSKPSKGAITWPKFICADCRPKPAPEKKAA